MHGQQVVLHHLGLYHLQRDSVTRFSTFFYLVKKNLGPISTSNNGFGKLFRFCEDIRRHVPTYCSHVGIVVDYVDTVSA